MEAKTKPIDGRNWESIKDKLTRPFMDEEVYWRLDRGNSILCYVDARSIMERLDKTVGSENWQCTYLEMPSGRVICKLGIRINKEWIWKEDGAGNPSMHGQNAESHAAKGGLSNALKRAAVVWGLARHLYDLGDTKVQMSNTLPADAPKCRIVKNKGQYGVAPSLRDIQFHLYSYDELVRHIEDPRARRLQRLHCIIRREGMEVPEFKAAFSAASAKWMKGQPIEQSAIDHPTKASDDMLKVSSQRLADWSERGVINDMVGIYVEWLLGGE